MFHVEKIENHTFPCWCEWVNHFFGVITRILYGIWQERNQPWGIYILGIVCLNKCKLCRRLFSFFTRLALSLDKTGCGSAWKNKIQRLLFLSCARLALSLDKTGCGSAKKMQIQGLCILLCARLALSFHKIGGGSAWKMKIRRLFFLSCARLALSLSPNPANNQYFILCWFRRVDEY